VSVSTRVTATSPVPGTYKRDEVMRRAEVYVPKEAPKHGTALIWLGAVLVVACLGALLFRFL